MVYKHRAPTQSVHVIDCYFLKSRTDCVGGHTHTKKKTKTKKAKTKTRNTQSKRKEKKRKRERKKAVTKNWPDRDSNPDPQN